MKLIECVPNFSEGRDLVAVAAIRDAIAAIDGVSILHVTSDASHNRSVITFVAPYETMAEAAFAGIQAASRHINLSAHHGVHPRMGAADVVPFIPLDGATMDDCVTIARAVGERVGRELSIPVFLYERAATRPSRQNLADVRRGGFERLRTAMETDPERVPDFGPRRVHPTAGAVAIGARPFLIAFNVYIGDTAQMPVAKAIAQTVRASNGGLPAVKALALEVDGQSQVSLNLVDLDHTSLVTAYDAVASAAHAHGADVTWSEIIGLIPERAMFETATQHLRLREPIKEHVLERRLRGIPAAAPTLRGYLDAVGDATPAPGGGSTAAYVGAIAAALVKMVAGLTSIRPRFASVHAEMRTITEEAYGLVDQLETLSAHDTEAYRAVVAAQRLPAETGAERTARTAAIHTALERALEIPLTTAHRCAQVVTLSTRVAARGNPNAVTDAIAAAHFAAAACRVAAENVYANARALGMTEEVRASIREVESLLMNVDSVTKTLPTLRPFD